jgi:hypothetical protein
MTAADATLEDRLARLERGRNSALIVAAAAIVAAAVAIVLPFLEKDEIVLRNAAGESTIVLSGETGSVQLRTLQVHNDKGKLRGEFSTTQLGGQVSLFNSEDEPVAVLNNFSPSQGGRLALYGIGDRAAFFGGTVTDGDFGMEVRMRPGVSAVLKMVNDVPFFSLADTGGEALIQVEDGVAEMFLNRLSILGPDALRRIELVGEENGGSVRLLDPDDQIRADLRFDDEAGGGVELSGPDGAPVWRAP